MVTIIYKEGPMSGPSNVQKKTLMTLKQLTACILRIQKDPLGSEKHDFERILLDSKLENAFVHKYIKYYISNCNTIFKEIYY